MGKEQYIQQTPDGVRQARIGYDLEHQRRGELADEALREGTWSVDFASIIFPRKFIREYCGGNDETAVARFGLTSVSDLHTKMDEKAEKVARAFGMTKEQLLTTYPGVYV